MTPDDTISCDDGSGSSELGASIVMLREELKRVHKDAGARVATPTSVLGDVDHRVFPSEEEAREEVYRRARV